MTKVIDDNSKKYVCAVFESVLSIIGFNFVDTDVTFCFEVVANVDVDDVVVIETGFVGDSL